MAAQSKKGSLFARKQLEDEPTKKVTNVFAQLPVSGTPPPPLREGEAMTEIQQVHPEYTVTLDAGSYWWVRRMVEVSALAVHTSRERRESAPEYYACALRTVEALRRSHDALTAQYEAPPKRRVLKRRAT